MENRVVLAFALTTAAGLSTCIGGFLIFFKCLIYLAKPARLGVALGMSAGVMIFISLVEIFHESINNFKHGISGTNNDIENPCKEKCNRTAKEEEVYCINKCEGNAWLFASLCFIGGVAIVYLLDFIVHKISPDAEIEPEVIIGELTALQNSTVNQNESQQHQDGDFIDMANREERNGLKQQQIENRLNDRVKQRLNRTGILTAIAIGIHNLPEGIATYLGAIRDTRLGYALAFGIALHNIPEGVAVAIPVYFATGNRFRAFLWTVMSALAEPFGGFICWLIMRKKDKDQVGKQNQPYLEGIIFGIIGGVMVTISLKELLPTAHQYCSHTNRVTLSVLGGMAIMAISLTLFAYAGV